MAVKKKGLGKGLDSLIPDNKPANKSADLQISSDSKESELNSGEQMMKINMVEPNRDQPRKNFEEDALLELSDSIKQFGILQPLLVRKRKDYYEIIAGERRWRAAKMAGIKEIPVIIKDYTEQEIIEIGLIENIQRENLNPIEEAEGLQALIDKCGFTQEEVASSVGKSRPAIANSLRLLRLPEAVRELTRDGKISAGHARALISLDNDALIIEAAENVIKNKLTVRDVERLAKTRDKGNSVSQKRYKRRDSFYDEVELTLSEVLGRKVKVYNGKGK